MEEVGVLGVGEGKKKLTASGGLIKGCYIFFVKSSIYFTNRKNSWQINIPIYSWLPAVSVSRAQLLFTTSYMSTVLCNCVTSFFKRRKLQSSSYQGNATFKYQ